MARKMKHVGNRDRNEPEIVAEFERLGFYVIRQPRDAGFDLHCIGEGRSIIVEVKNPETSWSYTDSELKLMEICREMDVPYYTILYAREVAWGINSDET